MGPLVWLLIPLVATLLAVVWVTWVNRPRRPADAHETLAAHQRFTAALERTEAGSTPAAARGPQPDPSAHDEPPAGSA